MAAPKTDKRKLRSEWLENPLYSPWLSAVADDPYKMYCTKCQKTFDSGLTQIKRHMETNIHVACSAKPPDVPQGPQIPAPVGQVKFAEILITTFISEHNLPFSTADHLSELCKVIFPDSAIARGIQLHRTKCTELAKKLGTTIALNVARKLRQNYFSIIIDETTDASKTKCLAVIVKFFDKDEGVIQTRMLDLIDLYGGPEGSVGSSGEALFTRITDTLKFYQIPFTNVVGFAADGTSSMMGEHNSVSSRMRIVFPGITIFKCTCHSLHLGTSEAAKTLPRQCENLIRNIYSHFSFSAKRIYELREYQEIFDLKPHRMLHPSQTRWLSLQMAVERVVVQWNALKSYFISIEPHERLHSINMIVNDMRDPAVFLILNFLHYILPTIVKVNVMFQAELPTIQLVSGQITLLYKTTLGYFCDSEKLAHADLSTFDPSLSANHKPVKDIWLGSNVQGLLQQRAYFRNADMVDVFQRRCQTFLIKLSLEIKERFDMSDPLLRHISFLDHKELLKPSTRDKFPSLLPLVQCLPRLYKGDIRTLDYEWRDLDSIEFSPELTDPKCGIIRFYQKLDELSVGDVRPFQNLAKFALQVLALPVSNTDAERLFSQVNLIKTNIRNKLNVETVSALIHISEAVKDQAGCYLFRPSDEMMQC